MDACNTLISTYPATIDEINKYFNNNKLDNVNIYEFYIDYGWMKTTFIQIVCKYKTYEIKDFTDISHMNENEIIEIKNSIRNNKRNTKIIETYGKNCYNLALELILHTQTFIHKS